MITPFLRLPAYPVLLAVLLAFGTTPLCAQTDNEPLLEEQRVTAVDTLLHFDRGGFSEWATGNATPEKLEAADFSVTLDGSPRQVVAIEALEHLDPSRRSRWTQLIYIDCTMSTTADLRRALALLHRELPRLLALGPLEVLIADPAPRRLIGETNSSAELEALLSRLALDTECHDRPQELRDELLRLKQEKREATPGEPSGAPPPNPAQIAAAAREAEQEAVRLSTLGLLQALSQEPRSIGSQKVVYLIHNGFDRRSEAFYLAQGALPDVPGQEPRIGPILLAKLIAAYGWTVMPVSESAFRASLKGVDIGRFVADVQSGEELLENNPQLATSPPLTPIDQEKRNQSLLGALTASLREKRDPKRAESYLELAQALLGAKKWAEAEDNFRKAIYHFDGVKKHQAKEAKAWLGVGMAKAGQGELSAGRLATERAIELDPKLVEQGEAETTQLGDRALFLAGLAEATLGRAVVGEEQLRRALGDLGIRIRLTFQITGGPTGRLMPLAVQHRGGERIKFLPWGRFGTPEEIATVRLLAALDDELGAVESDGGLDLAAFAATRGKLLDLDLLAGEEKTTMRVSILRGNPEGSLEVAHRSYQLAALPERDREASRLEFGVTGAPAFLALLVENLETGEWGIRTLDED